MPKKISKITTRKKSFPTPSPKDEIVAKSILQLLNKKNYTPLSKINIAKQLCLKPAEYKTCYHALIQLESRGLISRIKHDCYCLTPDAELIAGTLKFRPTGSALFQSHAPNDFQCLILAEDTATALHEDEVLIRLKPLSKKEKRLYPNESHLGQVVRVLNRTHTEINGTLQMRQGLFYIIPDDPRMPRNIFISQRIDPALAKSTIGDKVVVRVLEWDNRHMNPIGEIIANLGQSHTPLAEYEALLRKYDLSPTFSKNIEDALKELPSTIEAKDHPHRLDCQNLFTLTIDPVDAKDFDDALSLEILPNNEWRVGVHIADVAYYVKANTPLDLEAKKRGNSTYLVGTVIPMLPHTLSSGLCSLKENETRLAKSVFFTFNAQLQLISHTFHHTLIKSNKRLSYTQAIAFLKNNSLDALHELPTPPTHQTGHSGKSLKDLSNDELIHIQNTLKTLWKIAENLRKKRFLKGSLDLEMPEVKIYTDPEGYADRIEKIQYDESHQLIEEFMLLANETIAKTFFEQKIPFLSRVHDAPDPEKLEEYREYLTIFEIYVGDLTQREEVIKLLQHLKTHPQAHTLRLEFLKSLKQACYRPKTDGHYGLNKTYYTHFTSPIRRYTDLTIHRTFEANIPYEANNEPIKTIKDTPYTQKELNSLGEHVSITERLSTEAERESNKIKLLEYFERETQKKSKTTFKGIIVDIKSIGLFIELTDSLAFGLLHISDLNDDLYQINRNQTALIGRKYKKRYQLGDSIQIKIAKVNRFKRQIDFML